MTQYQDHWVCPACLKTFALGNAKTFMAKDAEGVLECPECHGANFSEFERWTPRLMFDGCDWCSEDERMWACHSGLCDLFPGFELEVQDGSWDEGLFIVAFLNPKGWELHEVAKVPPNIYVAPSVWLSQGFGRAFGCVFPFFRLAADHYSGEG